MTFPVAFALFAAISLFLYPFLLLATRLRFGKLTRQRIWAHNVIYAILVVCLAFEFFVAPHIPTHR
jgi:hypothetical protein